jgi:hypothetical protein
VIKELKQDPPKMIVTSSVGKTVERGGEELSRAASIRPLADAISKTWSQFEADGIPVVAIADIPRPNFNVPECVSEHLNALTECSFNRADSINSGTALKVAATSTKGVTFVDMNDAICPTPRCAAVIGGVLIYRDTNHMTATYSTTLGGHLNIRLPRTR